jgi:hypothetical protein
MYYFLIKIKTLTPGEMESQLDPRFIGAFVAIKVAQQQNMLSDDDIITLIKCFLKTHDMMCDDKDLVTIMVHPDMELYVDLVATKNKRCEECGK